MPKYYPAIQNGKVSAKALVDGYRRALVDMVNAEKKEARDPGRYDDIIRKFDKFVAENKDSNFVLKAAAENDMVSRDLFIRTYSDMIREYEDTPRGALRFYGDLGKNLEKNAGPGERLVAKSKGYFEDLHAFTDFNNWVLRSIPEKSHASNEHRVMVSTAFLSLPDNPSLAFAANEHAAPTSSVFKEKMPQQDVFSSPSLSHSC